MADVVGPERRTGERSEAGRSGGLATSERVSGVPDPEVPAKARRRRFTAEFKLDVLKEADACTEPGQLGALLRRHGLYSSNLIAWRKEHDAGARGALARKRGRKSTRNPLDARVAQLEREKRKLEQKLKRAELIIAFQKNYRAPRARPVGPETLLRYLRRRPEGVAVSLLVPSSP